MTHEQATAIFTRAFGDTSVRLNPLTADEVADITRCVEAATLEDAERELARASWANTREVARDLRRAYRTMLRASAKR